MEDYNKKKLGAGILTVSIIQLVIYALAIFGTLYVLISLNCNSVDETMLATIRQTKMIFYVSLIIYILVIFSTILIMFKKAVGVYIYFTVTIINIIFTFMLTGFAIKNITMLILPILMAIFIYRRRYVFNIGTKCTND